ncbi:DedA family protein [Candidatus Roizmanbacteria bacterium]|nr:DedA family protein [Candidatus Roizmanbacteria bacterium]
MELIFTLTSWMISFADSPYAPIALTVFAFVEASFFPIPPDALQIPLSLANPHRSFLYATIITLASIAGSIFGYYLGDKGGRKILHRIIHEDKMAVLRSYYQQYDVLVIIVAGFIPIPCKIFTLAAGALKLNFRRFVIATVIGRSLRFYPIAALIYIYGPAMQLFLQDNFKEVGLFIAIAIIVGFIGINYAMKLFTHQIKISHRR